jgi:hypothetical protein
MVETATFEAVQSDKQLADSYWGIARRQGGHLKCVLDLSNRQVCISICAMKRDNRCQYRCAAGIGDLSVDRTRGPCLGAQSSEKDRGDLGSKHERSQTFAGAMPADTHEFI